MNLIGGKVKFSNYYFSGSKFIIFTVSEPQKYFTVAIIRMP